MAKKERIVNPTKQQLLSLEREVLGFNLTSVLGEYKLKADNWNLSNIAYLNEQILDRNDLKGCMIAAVIDKIEYKTSQAGNMFLWIYLVDDYSSIKVYCNEKTFKEFANQLIVGKCCLFNLSVRNEFCTFDKCKLLEHVDFKKGTIFVIHLDPKVWSNDIIEWIEDNLGVFIQKGNVQVFQRTFHQDLFISPTYELIDIIKGKFGVKCTIENYEDFMWGESNKMLLNCNYD